jgi:hypothetical protein
MLRDAKSSCINPAEHMGGAWQPQVCELKRWFFSTMRNGTAKE